MFQLHRIVSCVTPTTPKLTSFFCPADITECMHVPKVCLHHTLLCAKSPNLHRSHQPHMLAHRAGANLAQEVLGEAHTSTVSTTSCNLQFACSAPLANLQHIIPLYVVQHSQPYNINAHHPHQVHCGTHTQLPCLNSPALQLQNCSTQYAPAPDSKHQLCGFHAATTRRSARS